ncbi:S9 family peptidase [Urechidicola croceus]|uniref:S9 family peptidase n=1 Tax=Urechidicola croceus TaxID=1850246 RepID=A0A1D8P544_9FLAO|nr:prolyl oligopeptidase family serine peptidase [Urechidicola croceus]AOW19689.1 S9 family peptidase [Urechidicola croceus]
MKNIISLIVLLSAINFYSQINNQSQLTIDQIMKGESFIGYSPTNIFWSDDSKTIYFQWNPNGEPIRSLYKYSLDSKNIDKVNIDEELQLTQSYDFHLNRDKTKKVFVKNGDVFLHNYTTNNTIQLINTFNERESNVSFSSNENSIIFEKSDNLFELSLINGKLKQLTNFQSGSESIISSESEQYQWLKNQQLDLFEVLRDRKIRRELNKNHSDDLKPKTPKTIYLTSKSISNLNINTENYITYKLSETFLNKSTITPHFVTESGYTEDQITRPKVGEQQTKHELWVYDIKSDSTFQVDISSLRGIYKKPLYLKDYDKNFDPNYDEVKEVDFVKVLNSPKNQATVYEIRSNDNKDRWFAYVDFLTGKLVEINHQHDEAWIGGPGIPWWNGVGDFGWLDDEHIWYHSEKTGFSHIYKTNIYSGIEKPLTSGNWEVHNVILAKDRNSMYITTNQDNAGERQLYKLNLKTLKSEKITSKVGNSEVLISPNEAYFAIRQSFSNKPWELFLLKNKKGSKETQITHSTSNEFENYTWKVPKNITFKAQDGIDVSARLYTPENGTVGKPAVIFVHGAGYLQNAHRWWSGYYREYMFHNYLVDNGYVVLDIDYRASKGYGRDFRTGIYRHMGGKDLSDQVDGVKYLIEELGIDKDNVGIYGGSYGGFITMMALFNESETFKSGAAIRSVTDWAHYNHAYASNILNTPVMDSLAFQRSSPINFADGLNGNLLILHGMIDDNVHFQDVVRLTQKLIELKKDNWEMALYPVERHGFIEPSSWADEYKRIYKLFESTLKSKN